MSWTTTSNTSGEQSRTTPPSAPLPEEGEDDDSVWRKRITDVYTTVNPDKLKDLGELFKKYEAELEKLYFRVCSKYKVAPALPLRTA